MAAKFKAYSITDLGGRKENQDSFLLLQKSSESGKYVLLAAVADGAGGFGEGQTASRGLLDAIRKWFGSVSAETFFSQSNLMNLMDAALKKIHDDMLDYAREKGITYGTTLTLLLILEDTKYIAAQVGDSRLYIYQAGELQQITKDQTVAQKERDTGSEIHCSSNKESTLLQCFGAGTVSPKYYDGTLHDSAQIMLCSDGQSNKLENSEIKEVLETEKHPEEKLDFLLRMARNKGEQDNITTVLITKEQLQS